MPYVTHFVMYHRRYTQLLTKIDIVGTREVAHWLRTPVVLEEDLSSVIGINTWLTTISKSRPGNQKPFLDFRRHQKYTWCT